MKKNKNTRQLSVVKTSHPAYPNAADSNYVAAKALNIVTALVSGMGFISAMLFLVTMV